MKVAIIGAGPAGLTIAHQLSKNNIEVDIYDNAENVGGFAKTIKVFNQNVEIGPHFLDGAHFPAVKNLITDLLGRKFTTYKRKTYILTLDKFFQYPPAIYDIVRKLRFNQLLNAGAGLLKAVLLPLKPDGTAERYVRKMLGDYLFEHFFQNFSKKLWSISAGQLSDVFVRSLLGFDNKSSVAGIVWKKIKSGRGPKAMQQSYIYPEGGFSALWEAMKAKIETQGGRFFLSVAIEELRCADDHQRVEQLMVKNGSNKEYDLFISTIPNLRLIAYLKTNSGQRVEPLGSIRFQNDILLYLQVTYDTAISGQCFYVYSEKIKITRVTNFNEFDAQNKSKSIVILLLEFWCNDNDPLWHANEIELLQTAKDELKKTNIFTGLDIINMTVKKVKNAFQIPDLDLIANQEKLFAQLAQYKNLVIAGRNASVSFNYGMENAMDDAISLAEQLIPLLNKNVALADTVN